MGRRGPGKSGRISRPRVKNADSCKRCAKPTVSLAGRTLSKRRCQNGSHSRAAASMHSSTAAARSGRMLRMFSSALGDLLEKFSHASNRMAEGDVEPGRKTETDDAGSQDEWDIKRNASAHVPGTFCTKSHVSGPIMRMPSGSVTANVDPE